MSHDNSLKGSSILLVEDDESLRTVLAMNLEDSGLEVDVASSAEDALERFSPQRHQIVLTDLRLPGMHGLELLERLKAVDDQVVVLVLTAYGGAANALEAMRRGAFHYVEKPVNTQALLEELRRALDYRERRPKSGQEARGVERRQMIASSPAMNRVLKVVDRVADSMAPVMILGESGVGKELVAHAIHDRSGRSTRPFVAVNCAAIPPELLESTLFGYEKGAFTGAQERKPGKFIAADGGTLFLDEIAEMSIQLQSKLLRVLQDGLVERVGSVKPERVNVRILTATHQDLTANMAQGTFRRDLYYRLHVVPIEVPPLRERREDIPVLMRHFLRGFKVQHGESIDFSQQVDDIFLRYDWPGNVRELRNVVERMILLREDDCMTARDVPEEILEGASIRGMRSDTWRDVAQQGLPFALPEGGLDLQEFEAALIKAVIVKHDGNQSAAARYLNIPRHVLLYRIEKYGIDLE